MNEKLKAESIRMALDIVRNNPLHVSACTVEGSSPDAETVGRFEAEAAELVRGATPGQLAEVYDEVLAHGEGEEPVAPSTLLRWIGDRAGDGSVMVDTVDLEGDR